MQQRKTLDRMYPRIVFFAARRLALVILASLLIGIGGSLQTVWAQTPATPNPPLMKEEERLPYLRKLKAFLEADPLDIAEFERQFEVKLECRPWRSKGKVCDYRTNEVRWPYSVYEEPTNKVRYSMHGDGSSDLIWISLLHSNNPGSYNCITGNMLKKIFTSPRWESDAGLAKTAPPHSDSTWILSLDGQDKLGRRVVIVTTGVYSCTGTLQITVHPLK